MTQPVWLCPFDAWDGDSNPNLKGGWLVGATVDYFAYAFGDPEGQVERVLIARKVHGDDPLELLFSDPLQLVVILRMSIAKLRGSAYNLTINYGRDAGETVMGHAHLHVIRRRSGEPASGKGLIALLRECNEASAP